MKLGPLEIALIVLAVVLIFGVGKLGQIGGALGRSIREFRKEKDKATETTGTAAIESKGQSATAQLESPNGKERFCPNCGEKMSANAKFCMGCGAKTEDFSCKTAQR